MAKAKRKTKRNEAPYTRQKFLCTRGEWRFCKALDEAVGDQFTVMMQVRVGSLLTVPGEDWKRWGRRVSQKSFDFALVSKGSSYVAGVVELDDKTHLLPGRIARDRFLDDACRRAGLPLIRFRTARRYDVEVIRETIRDALPKGNCEIKPREVHASGEEHPGGWSFRRVKRIPLSAVFQS